MIIDLDLIYVDGSPVVFKQRPQPHTIPQGVTAELRFNLRNSQGTAVNITGWTFAYTLKEDRDDATEIISKAGTITAAVTGGGKFVITEADTVTQLIPELLPRSGAYVSDVIGIRPGNIREPLLVASDTFLGPLIGEPGAVVTPAPSAGSLVAGALQARTVVATNVVSLSGPQTLNGVSLLAGDVALLTGQTGGIGNGLWVINAVAWTRPASFVSGLHAAGVLVTALEGTADSDTLWICTTNRPTDTIDTNPIAFGKIGQIGGGGNVAPVGVLGAVDVEDPIATIIRRRLTADDIDPAFSGSISGSASPRALGNTLVNPQFTFTASAALSAVAGDVTVTDDTDTQNIVPATSPFGYGAPGTLGARSYVSSTINATKTWDLKLTKIGGSPVIHRIHTVQFQPAVYFGKSSSVGPFNSAFITGLGAATLASGRGRDVVTTTGAGEFVFYCFPATFGGTAADFIDLATNFPFGVSKVAAGVSVDNGFGVFVFIDIWRSDFPNLGATTMRVS